MCTSALILRKTVYGNTVIQLARPSVPASTNRHAYFLMVFFGSVVICERSGLFGVVERMERYQCNFRFLSGRKWITRQGFDDSVVSVWTRVPTAAGSDEGPATGWNSVSGRAISGSGLGTTPGRLVYIRAYNYLRSTGA